MSIFIATNVVVSPMYKVAHDFAIVLSAFAVVLTILLSGALCQTSKPSRRALIWYGWLLVTIGCMTLFGLFAIGDASQLVTSRLLSKQAHSNRQPVESEQVITRQNASVQQVVETYKIIVPLIVAGIGVGFIAAGVGAAKEINVAKDGLGV